MLKLNDPQGYKGIACANESLLGNNRKNERTNERAVVKIKCICLEKLERNKISHTTPLRLPFADSSLTPPATCYSYIQRHRNKNLKGHLFRCL